MQNSSLEETQPTGIEETQPSSTREDKPQKKGRYSWVRLLILGWVLLILVAALGGYSGYQQGIQDRLSLRTTQTVEEIENQYQLGLEDFNAGAYERARQRFEYIIDLDPNHARAIEMLARTIAVLQATATPTPLTPSPTPSLTPTPDLRAVEELFQQAQFAMTDGNWDLAIETLLNLRKNDPDFEAIETDSMLYVALRNRGVEKILNKGELESGLYDLSQSELFGPLDTEAQSFSNFARLYIIGASFWQVDWAQSAFYFGQVAPYLPNLHDGTGWTATQRYIEAMQNYINLLAENEDWCRAEDQMDILRSGVSNPEYEATQTWLSKQCSPPTKTPKPPTPTVEIEIPTETETPTPTP